MITTNRNEFIGFHVTIEQKEQLKLEAIRRSISLSAMLANIVEQWLESAPKEQLEKKRSNKRIDPLRNIPLPLEKDR